MESGAYRVFWKSRLLCGFFKYFHSSTPFKLDYAENLHRIVQVWISANKSWLCSIKQQLNSLLLDIFLFNNFMVNQPLLHVLGRRHYFALTAILLSHNNFWPQSFQQQTIIVQTDYIGKISSGTNQWEK